MFASRATFRPNGIGMSAVELKGISHLDGHIYIDLGSVDLVDGTPIVDIKPYIPTQTQFLMRKVATLRKNLVS